MQVGTSHLKMDLAAQECLILHIHIGKQVIIALYQTSQMLAQTRLKMRKSLPIEALFSNFRLASKIADLQ